jgi:hypothetical protein
MTQPAPEDLCLSQSHSGYGRPRPACAQCTHGGGYPRQTVTFDAMPPVDWQGVMVMTTGQRWICPDLLRLSDLGAADNWRGRTVRGFFRVLGWVTGL